MDNKTETEIIALKANISKMRNQRDHWKIQHDANHNVVCSLLTYDQLVEYWVSCDHSVKVAHKTIIDYVTKKNGKKSYNKFHMTPITKRVLVQAKDGDEPRECYEFDKPESEEDLRENFIWDKDEKIFLQPIKNI